MSLTTIQFTYTEAGQIAFFDATNTGVALTFTHVQIGTGNATPSGAELHLVAPKQTAPFAAGGQVGKNQIRLSAIFTGAEQFDVCEIALWAGDPAVAGSVLVAYWSQPTGRLMVKSPNVDFVFAHDMALGFDVPLGTIKVLVDPTQSVMLAALYAHESKANPHVQYDLLKDALQRWIDHNTATDPHAQYTTTEEVVAIVESRVGDYVLATGTATDYVCVLTPPVTSYAAGLTLSIKAPVTNTGALTLNAGGGVRPLVRVDGTPMQAGDIQGGSVVTILWDASTNSFRSSEVVASQVRQMLVDYVKWANVTDRPTKVSQFVNDSGYLSTVSWDMITGRYSKLSQFTNDTGFITASATVFGANNVMSNDGDRNAGSKLPTTSPRAVRFDFSSGASAGMPSRYAGVMTYSPWDGTAGSSGDASYQVAYGGTASDGGGTPMVNIRKGIDGSWGSWITFVTSANYNSYAPSLTGGGASGTWNISVGGSANYANTAGRSNYSNSADYVAWANVGGRPTNVSSFSNDAGYITASSWPAGLRMMWHSSSPPSGFLICDGSAISRAAYGGLFNAIGVMFGGGDGYSTFNLPDHRNRTHMGAGGSYGSGAVGGSADAVLPSHDHWVSISGGTSYGGAHTHTYRTHRRDVAPSGSNFAGNASTNYDWYNWQTGVNPGDAEGNHSHSVSVSGYSGASGQSAYGANIPPFIASHIIIKY